MSDEQTYEHHESAVTGSQRTPYGIEGPSDDPREMPAVDSPGRKDQTEKPGGEQRAAKNEGGKPK